MLVIEPEYFWCLGTRPYSLLPGFSQGLSSATNAHDPVEVVGDRGKGRIGLTVPIAKAGNSHHKVHPVGVSAAQVSSRVTATRNAILRDGAYKGDCWGRVDDTASSGRLHACVAAVGDHQHSGGPKALGGTAPPSRRPAGPSKANRVQAEVEREPSIPERCRPGEAVKGHGSVHAHQGNVEANCSSVVLGAEVLCGC